MFVIESFPLNINLPIFKGRLISALIVEVQDQRLLDPHIQLYVLLLRQLCVVPLLQQHEPLTQAPLELHRINYEDVSN